jgi:hypothetical protein
MSLALTACAAQIPAPAATQARGAPTAAATAHDHVPLAVFYELLEEGPGAMVALARIESDWDDAYASMLLDLIYFSTSPKMDAACPLLGADGHCPGLFPSTAGLQGDGLAVCAAVQRPDTGDGADALRLARRAGREAAPPGGRGGRAGPWWRRCADPVADLSGPLAASPSSRT